VPCFSQHFQTVTRLEHKATVYDRRYQKSKPFPGFDRQTANKTNYSLGSENPGENRMSRPDLRVIICSNPSTISCTALTKLDCGRVRYLSLGGDD
jgi:hypothetical protein